MRSFLVKDKKPLWKWRDIPEGVTYCGQLPEGYDLAISPGPGIIVVDIDMHGKVDGYDTIPNEIMVELSQTLFYKTRGNGTHCWFRYTGNEILPNKTSNLGIDIRVESKGYVVWYHNREIESCLDEINFTSKLMNEWIESIFKAKTKLKR